MTLPIGYAHPFKRKDFGSLPLAPRKLTSTIARPQQNPKPVLHARVAQDTGTKTMPVLPANIQMANGRDRIGRNQPSHQPVKRRRKKHPQQGKNRKKLWLTVAIVLGLGILIILVVINSKR
jgi:hypothetical protein